MLLPWQLAWGIAVIAERMVDPREHVIPGLFGSVHSIHHLSVLVSPAIPSVVLTLVSQWKLVNAGLYAGSLEVPIPFHETLCLLQRRRGTSGLLLMVGRGCSRRTHTASLTRRYRVIVKHILAVGTEPGMFLLQRPDLCAQIRQHREQPLNYLFMLVYVYRLRTDGQLHILVRISRLFLELLHPIVDDLLRFPNLPDFSMEYLHLLRARFVELRLLLPRGGGLPTDVVEVVLAILGEFGVLELPTLFGRSVLVASSTRAEREYRCPPLHCPPLRPCFLSCENHIWHRVSRYSGVSERVEADLLSWRTKLAKLLCLKCCGRIFLVKSLVWRLAELVFRTRHCREIRNQGSASPNVHPPQ